MLDHQVQLVQLVQPVPPVLKEVPAHKEVPDLLVHLLLDHKAQLAHKAVLVL